MDPLLKTLLLVLVLYIPLLLVTVILFRQWRSTAREKIAIEGEEKRMFGFLHLLGQAIEEDYSSRKLFRVIVNGLEEVLGVEGAALYLVSSDGKFLVPAHVSDSCPPLWELSSAQRKEVGSDPARMTSYLRLARVPSDDGMLWSRLRARLPERLPGLWPHGKGKGGGPCEAMVAPVIHAGRDLGVVAVIAKQSRRPFSGNDFEVFRSIAEQSAFALGNSMVHLEASEKRRLERELRMASEVQRVLLPGADPESAGYRISGTNVPARIVSGDYYDYIPLPTSHLGVAIADVSGKGFSAGLLMATCRSALRSLAPECDSPSSALAAVNRQLFADMREDMFISMAYAILENGSGRVTLARAGHEAPLLYRRASGEVERLKSAGLAIGIDEGAVFERVTEDLETELLRGDCLLLFTDGINEAENEKGEEFGTERLRKTFEEGAAQGAVAAVTMLQDALRRFVAGHRQMDDITMIAIEKR